MYSTSFIILFMLLYSHSIDCHSLQNDKPVVYKTNKVSLKLIYHTIPILDGRRISFYVKLFV